MKNKLVRLAREAINSYYEGKKISEEKFKEFNEKKGVFVTLRTLDGKLRGCIGRIKSNHLGRALVDSAISAAFHDPRFKPVERNEKFKIEVSVLEEPQLIEIDNEKDLKKIKIGRDGLIVESYGHLGLLLPIVAVEHKLNEKQFLEHTCLKAGLNKDSWKNRDCRVYKFEVEIFKE
jgi:AmmeMemoRadiSam system protein A